MSFQFLRLFTRTHWVKCHLYLALVLGLFFAIIGLTGSLSVYREALDILFNPELEITNPHTPKLSLDRILGELRKAHPNRHGAWTLELPRDENTAITAWFDKPRESVDKFYAPLMVAVNPYTGEIISNRFWGETFTTALLNLHTDLLMENSGRYYVAALGILLSLSVISGLYLWWPGLAKLKQTFGIRHNAGLMRLLMDTHRLLGFFSAPFLLLLAFTGFHLAYPNLLETLTASTGMSHGNEGPNVSSTSIPNNRPISIAEAVLVARGLFPSSEVRRITTPQGDLGTYRVNLRQRHELNQHHPFTTVWIDRWSGQIKSVNNPNQFSLGQTFTTWQWPLHTGEAFGDTGRLIWFVLGLLPSFFYVSGVVHWLHRKGLIQDKVIDLPASSRRLSTQTIEFGKKVWRYIQPILHRGFVKLRHLLSEIKE